LVLNLLACSRRALVMGVAAAAATLSMTQVASAEPAPPDVPTAIAVDTVQNKVFRVGRTKDGVSFQVYRCTADGTSFKWTFIKPEATLTGDNGKDIISHFAGPAGPTQPTWQATDGSKVTGKVTGRDPDPLPACATNIQQLRLEGTPTPVGADGGRLGATTFIPRVATTGGVAPDAAKCSGTTVNTEEKVPYGATYYFWKKTGPGA
jgi:Protein of unknown function (DUF3455)